MLARWHSTRQRVCWLQLSFSNGGANENPVGCFCCWFNSNSQQITLFVKFCLCVAYPEYVWGRYDKMIHGSTLKYRKERIFQVSFWAHIVHLFPTSESNGIWSAVFRSWKETTARIPHSKHRICKKKDKISKLWEVLQVSSYSYKKILYQSILSISDILPPQTKRGSQPENKPKQKKENPIHHPSESLVGSINCIMHCYQLNILKTTSGWETMQWFSWGELFLFWGKLCGLHFSIKHIGNRLSVGLSYIYIESFTDKWKWIVLICENPLFCPLAFS